MLDKSMQAKIDQRNKAIEQEAREVKEREKERKEYLETIKQEIGAERKNRGRPPKKNKNLDKTIKIEFDDDYIENLEEEDD